MSELIIVNDSCNHCGVAFLGSENYCRNCGLPTVTSVYPIVEAELLDSPYELATVPNSLPAVTAQPDQPILVNEILGNRLLVIAILLCVGPIGLPALWFSPRFKKRSKIIISTAYLLFTLALPIAITWYFLDFAIRPIVDVLGR